VAVLNNFLNPDAGIFTMKTIPDTRAVKSWLAAATARVGGARPLRAVVVGGGFIGLEMAENLKHLGVDVTIVEMLTQVGEWLGRMLEIAHRARNAKHKAW
jgi:NADPH-dependent 2,4-dienoyl-CoA reductase/sulfur reductase-like enzyme